MFVQTKQTRLVSLLSSRVGLFDRSLPPAKQSEDAALVEPAEAGI